MFIKRLVVVLILYKYYTTVAVLFISINIIYV